jgi:hypothetical protein
VIAPPAPEPGPTRPTIAVIPLRLLGQEPEHQLLGDALAVQVSGHRLEVMVERVEAPGGHVVWADRLLGDLRAVWATEDSMISTIVSEVGAAVMQHELERASSHALPTVMSYSLLLGAIAMMHRNSTAEFDTAKAMLVPRPAGGAQRRRKLQAACSAPMLSERVFERMLPICERMVAMPTPWRAAMSFGCRPSLSASSTRVSASVSSWLRANHCRPRPPHIWRLPIDSCVATWPSAPPLRNGTIATATR